MEMIETRPDLPRQTFQQHGSTSSLTSGRSNKSAVTTGLDHCHSLHSACASGGASVPLVHFNRQSSAAGSSVLGQTSTTSRDLQRTGEDYRTPHRVL